MSLLHPTTADIWDRIIVLRMKIAAGTFARKPVGHFEAELLELMKRSTPATWKVEDRLLTKLADLHAKIWDGIDLMLATPAVTDANCRQLAEMGVNLQTWNRERVRIKELIDKATGEFTGEEKLDVHRQEDVPSMRQQQP